MPKALGSCQNLAGGETLRAKRQETMETQGNPRVQKFLDMRWKKELPGQGFEKYQIHSIYSSALLYNRLPLTFKFHSIILVNKHFY